MLTRVRLSFRYHWALTVGPGPGAKTANAVRYHAKNSMTSTGMKWQFEEKQTTLEPTNMILVRVLVGKVVDGDRLKHLLHSVPVVEGDETWNCVIWVRDALELLERDGKAIGTRQLVWKIVRDAAMAYCQKKREEHRFDQSFKGDRRQVPTYDLLERKDVLAQAAPSLLRSHQNTSSVSFPFLTLAEMGRGIYRPRLAKSRFAD